MLYIQCIRNLRTPNLHICVLTNFMRSTVSILNRGFRIEIFGILRLCAGGRRGSPNILSRSCSYTWRRSTVIIHYSNGGQLKHIKHAEPDLCSTDKCILGNITSVCIHVCSTHPHEIRPTHYCRVWDRQHRSTDFASPGPYQASRHCFLCSGRSCDRSFH